MGMPDQGERERRLAELLSKFEDAPRDWFIQGSMGDGANGQVGHQSIEALSCSSFKELEEAWKDAMLWRKDMGDALAVLLAVCASTQQAGNQLFLQLIGSASGGKTVLLEGLLVSHHCHHLEHLTGFFSGWKKKDDEDNEKDCSLIGRVNGKTLITPEADVLVSSPRFVEIMGQQRRIFDGKSGATYKNSDQDKIWAGLRTPWIMAGTPSMMDHDQSHLGDRFLRFMLADPPIDEKRAIMLRAMRSECTAMLDSSNGTAGSIVDPKTRLAHALTGGYVDWLRAHVEELIQEVNATDDVLQYCADLAELSADLRARPVIDKRKTETHDHKENPTRLARQNIRMATCLAVVLNKTIIDTQVLCIVRKIALDTALGHSLSIVQWLCSMNPKDPQQEDYGGCRTYQETGGLMTGILETWTGMPKLKLERYLTFLRKMDILEMGCTNNGAGNSWFLTERVHTLYTTIMAK